VHIDELRDADEVFLTGTSAEIVPIVALDERVFAGGPVASGIAARYADIVRGRAETWRGWLTEV
jgi:branched-chain amino acid aminotransferase